MDLIKIYIIDIVLVLIFLLTEVYYYKKGFVRSLLEFFSFFASLIITKVFSPAVSEYLITNTDFFEDYREYKINLLSVILLFIISSLVLNVIIRFIDKIFKLPILKTANKFLGLLLGTLTSIFVITIISFILKLVALSGYEPLATAVSNSKIISADSLLIAKLFPTIAEYIQGGFLK